MRCAPLHHHVGFAFAYHPESDRIISQLLRACQRGTYLKDAEMSEGNSLRFMVHAVLPKSQQTGMYEHVHRCCTPGSSG